MDELCPTESHQGSCQWAIETTVVIALYQIMHRHEVVSSILMTARVRMARLARSGQGGGIPWDDDSISQVKAGRRLKATGSGPASRWLMWRLPKIGPHSKQ